MACKCYFSLPPPSLSPLLIWAYVKLILSVAYVALAGYMMALLVQQNHLNAALVPTTVWIGLAFVNLTFSNIFIVGLHNKTYTMLPMFLIYSVLEVILTSAWQVWCLIKVLPSLSYDSNSFYNYWRQQLTPIECLKFFVPLVFHILLPIYFITHIRTELLKIKVQNSPEVEEFVKKASEENIPLNSSVKEEQNRENNFSNSSAPTEETLSPLNSIVSEEQIRIYNFAYSSAPVEEAILALNSREAVEHNREYNFANSSAPTEENLPPLNGIIAEEQNREYNFANSSAPPEDTLWPFYSAVVEEQNRRYNYANSSAPPEETLLPFDSPVTEEQNRRYNFANSSAPADESLISRDSTVAAERKRIYNFANPSAPPEEIALYPVDELKGLTTDNKDQ